MSVDYNCRDWVQSSALYIASVVRNHKKKPSPKAVFEILIAFSSWKLSKYSKIGFPELWTTSSRQTLLLLFYASSWTWVQLTFSSCQWQNRQIHVRNPWCRSFQVRSFSENKRPIFFFLLAYLKMSRVFTK